MCIKFINVNFEYYLLFLVSMKNVNFSVFRGTFFYFVNNA